MPLACIAERLKIGSRGYLTRLVQQESDRRVGQFAKLK
jgi:hypothetical protein